MVRCLLFLLGLSLALMPVTQAAIYKWVDRHGNVHYGEQPGSNQAKEIKIKPPPGKSKSKKIYDRLERQQRLLKRYDMLRQVKEKKRREETLIKAENKLRCINSKDQLRTLLDTPYIYGLDAKGNRITKSGAERLKVIEQLRAEIRRSCGLPF